MSLKGDRHSGGRAIPVLSYDQVRFARPRRFLLVLILAVQENYYVGVLFDRAAFT